MVVPEGKTFLVYPNMFNGPCKPSSITITVAGTIIAPDTTDKWKGIDASLWLGFNNVNGVTVNGNGNFNGRGLNWWNQSCALSHYKPSKAVHISGISYTDLTGSSATPVAINLNCSSTVSCDGLTFDTIQISSASKGQKVTAACNHASGKTTGVIDPPLSCLSPA
ncbi:Polygalacturonase ADPG1 [Acorus calamus]|uniref:Polygalacturonase ADPG1 n=1 Tax=Acorus calamus TaxID=4465 RepID=A0AAV9C3U9_ACOCL|nr:Polygalacturonase ADPG1 [Acorus calamus]